MALTSAQRAKRFRTKNPGKVKAYDKARQDKNRARKRARYQVEKKLGKSKVKGKDVHHKNGNCKDNSSKNLAVVRRYHGHPKGNKISKKKKKS